MKMFEIFMKIINENISEILVFSILHLQLKIGVK